MFLRLISIALLFIGCSKRVDELYLPKIEYQKQAKIEVFVKNSQNPPWIVGLIDKKPIRVERSIEEYIKNSFLKKINKKTKAKIDIDIKKLWIWEYKSKIYGYMLVEVTYHFKNAIFVKKIEIKRVGIRDIQKSLLDMLDEVVDIMVESYEMYFVQ